MKNVKTLIASLAFAALFSGCTRYYPPSTQLELNIPSQPTGVYDGDASAAISGKDLRMNREVIAYRVDDGEVIRIDSMDPPQDVIVKNLAAGLEQQGLVFKSETPVFLTVEINELVVNVTKATMLYKADAISKVSLNIRNGDSVFSKTYSQESYNESVSRPKVDKLRKMLDDQLSEIVGQMLQDPKIQNVIAGR